MPKRVLVVDDDTNVRELCCRIAKLHKYETEQAENISEAFDKLKKQSVDLILCDLVMETKDGLELLRRIKSDSLRIPVIIMTGYEDARTAVEAMKLGAYAYLTKPFEIDELSITIKKCIEQKSNSLQVAAENKFTSIQQSLLLNNEAFSEEKDLMNAILQQFLDLTRSDSGSIMLSDNKSSFHIASSIGLKQDITKTILPGEGIAGWVAQNRKPIILNDKINKYPQFSSLSPRPEIFSSVCLPMIFQNNVVGIICLNRLDKDPLKFTETELDVLEKCVTNALIITINYRHVQRLKALEQLKNEFKTPLASINEAIDLLEGYSEGKVHPILKIAKREVEKLNKITS